MRLDVMSERHGKIVSQNDAEVVLVRIYEEGNITSVRVVKSDPGDTPEIRVMIGDECVWSVIEQ